MELSLDGDDSGPSRIPLASKQKKPWSALLGSNAHLVSSDASLFSSSLPVLPHEKLAFNESEGHGVAVDDSFPNLNKLNIKDDVSNPLEDIEPSPIGSLLPGDEDELLAGLTDDFDLNGLPTRVEDLEDDFFGSGGGLELETESHENILNSISKLSISNGSPGNSTGQYTFQNGGGTVSGEHPYGEHPSRTLFVRNINSNVEDAELRTLFERYGDIRTLYTACKHRGFVMISYYDIRDARTAMRDLQNKPLRRRRLDIHFSIPKDNPSEKDINQGTLVVFNLDPSVSSEELRCIFGAFGEVKEIRETPHKKHHKFIEFYDVRSAELALKALNRSDIAGKRIKLEPSRPGGARRSLVQQLGQDLERDEARTFPHQVGSPLPSSPPGSWPIFGGSPVECYPLHGYSQSPSVGTISPMNHNNLPGLASILPSHASSPAKIAPIGKESGRVSHGNQVFCNVNSAQGVAYQHSVSISEQNSSLSPAPVSLFADSKSNTPAVGTPSGPQFLLGSPTVRSADHTHSSGWKKSSVVHPFALHQQGHAYPYSAQQGSFLGSHHLFGSAPSVIPPEKHFGFFSESPETSYISQAAFCSATLDRNNTNGLTNMGAPGVMNMGVAFAGNYTLSDSPSSRMIPLSRNGPLFSGIGSNGGIGATNYDGFIDRGRNKRVASGNQIDNKKQYELDLDKIISGEDTRTTLMIKNIPNKYTSKMLLAAIDESHEGTYDFLYLPIDFKNKCNVGYAFINMVSPSHIITFFQTFDGKKWEKFNSEKVASLAYARIQGKAALVAHFQNSSLMNEDKRCRPILFQSEGHWTGDQEALLSNNLNICIRQPDGSYSGDALDSPKDHFDEKLDGNFLTARS